MINTSTDKSEIPKVRRHYSLNLLMPRSYECCQSTWQPKISLRTVISPLQI